MASRSRGQAGPPGPKKEAGRAEATRGVSIRVASSISPMGVIPAMGSLPKGKL
jgi:hypothetical protein